MQILEQIKSLLEVPLANMGFEIVRIQLQESKRQVLEIMIERVDRNPVSLDNCVAVTREASILLDLEDPVKGSYMLEVTSPGMDRPLVKRQDFERFLGKEVKLKTYLPIDGQKRFKGVLQSLEDEMVVIEVEVGKNEGNVLRIPLQEIRTANLVPEFG